MHLQPSAFLSEKRMIRAAESAGDKKKEERGGCSSQNATGVARIHTSAVEDHKGY